MTPLVSLRLDPVLALVEQVADGDTDASLALAVLASRGLSPSLLHLSDAVESLREFRELRDRGNVDPADVLGARGLPTSDGLWQAAANLAASRLAFHVGQLGRAAGTEQVAS